MKISLSTVVAGSILDEQGRTIGFIGNSTIAAHVVHAVNAHDAQAAAMERAGEVVMSNSKEDRDANQR